MSLSIFAKQIESLARERSSFEEAAQSFLSKALNSFISNTEVNLEEVYFKQEGYPKSLDELCVVNGVFKFEWGISIAHDGYDLQTDVPVYAVQVINSKQDIFLGIGEHPGSDYLENELFMRKLIDHLTNGIDRAFLKR